MSSVVCPTGWSIKSLINVATLQRGYDLPVQDREEGKFPIFAANGPVGFHSSAKCKGPGVITGRSGTIGKVHFVEGDYWPLNTALYVTDFHGNEPKWVYYMLRDFGLERFSQGAGVPTLNRNLVHGEPIKVPPLPEQRRIAAILDKAESLRMKRREALTQLNRLEQSVFVDLFGDPVSNPMDWPTKRLDGVASLINGRAFKPDEWEEQGLPIIRIQNLNDESKPFNYTTQQLPERFKVTTGDILFSWSGTPGTSFGCFRWSRGEGWLNQHIFKVGLDENTLRGDFFIAQLNLKLGELISKAHGGVGLQHVTKGMVDETLLIVPPLDLQDRYLSRIRAVKALFNRARSADREKASLSQSLQNRAFQGEL